MYFHKCSAKQHAQHLNTDIAVSSINLGMRLFQKLAWRTLQKQYEFVKRLFILAGLREPYSKRRECYSFVAFEKQCKPHGARAQSRSRVWPSQRPTGQSQPNLTESRPKANRAATQALPQPPDVLERIDRLDRPDHTYQLIPFKRLENKSLKIKARRKLRPNVVGTS